VEKQSHREISSQTVFVVDDHRGMREALGAFLRSAGLRTESHPSANEFLARFDRGLRGCLVLDLRMPGMSGLDLQERLRSLGSTLPVIVVSAFAAVSDAVRSMKLGSFEFIEKPYSSEFLLERVRAALAHEASTRRTASERSHLRRRFDGLTPREHEILSLVIAGRPSKGIADSVGLSVSTVDNHRANIMKKVRACGSAELVRFAISSGLFQGGSNG
jgi:FixJ family two-component response regulator